MCFLAPSVPHTQEQKLFSGPRAAGKWCLQKSRAILWWSYHSPQTALSLAEGGPADFSIANVRSAAFVTDPASVLNYVRGCKAAEVAAAAAALHFKTGGF